MTSRYGLISVFALLAAFLLGACQVLPDPGQPQEEASPLDVILPRLEETPLATAAPLYAVPVALKAERPHTVELASLPRVDIERVVDGDTVIVHYQNQRERLRLLGIDVPESSANPDASRRTAAGDVFSETVSRLLEGRQIYLEFDEAARDQYGRLLAYVWLDEDTMLNENLVYSGLARVVRFPPNVAYYRYFKTLERASRDLALGIHGPYKDDAFRQ